ncbi:TPA: hypothetical protein I9089_002431 [Clostridium perfringens]|nr:hypothetical protein [Clostridium perfringens]
MRKVFLENLPKKGNRINWKESIGYKVPFVYDDIEGEIEIIDYLVNNKKLMIAYDINKINISTGNFQKCRIGKILMKITNDFKINVGEKFIDEKRYLTIIDKKYKKSGKWKQKYYKYHCNKCGNEDWIEESKLISEKRGCNTCCSSPRKVVLGINTIWDTDRWMVD